MIHKPTAGQMWGACIVWHKGTYYLFSEILRPHRSMWTASSADGVHWKPLGPVIDNAPFNIYKMFVARCGGRWLLNHGSLSGKRRRHVQWNDTLRFWASDDLVHWTYLGEKFDLHPDPNWYREQGRCDHMYMIPKVEGRPDGGYWGYCVATPNAVEPHKTLGMLESTDGADWRWLPPPAFDWGGVPQQFMEVGGCERIDGRYYLIQGARFGYMGHFGYSTFTFVADQPAGPFRPDLEAYRLCGNSHDLGQLGYSGKLRNIGVQDLASFGRGDGELLLTNCMVSGWAGVEDVWFAPIKKAIVDGGGHLRMGYWQGNEALKGREISIDLARCERVHPAIEDAAHTVRAVGNRIELTDPRTIYNRHAGGGTIVILPDCFDMQAGVVLEGTLTLLDTSEDELTHRIPVSAGFYFEELPGRGKTVLFETLGITRIDRVDYSSGKLAFVREDTTGSGCATAASAAEGRTHAFRLLLRLDMFELYLNDRLVQAFFISPQPSGRLGLVVEDGACVFAGVRAWQVTPL